MQAPWATRDHFRRGWLGQFGALVALFGFLFTITTPGLALVNVAGQSVAVTGILGVYVCHARGGGQAALPGETPASSDECCLLCQVAQLANGAVPPQHFTLPTESAAAIRLSTGAQDRREGEASRHAQARAPPQA
ncbi:DUF2946 family protein [Magnetospirillum aberrantis]|uniref:DUF2946 domain-containing protein n=1 Tax=Magnetospirillum aberrantis SpK TaxID=908842 RepID=A0A7C9QR67_9PROT|nr:DUF2946 family protein [Magnetospirillum aberrantis]NFV78600.1 hypothetical protein [Magnetospirillum aberrantis SpK]